MVPVLEAVPNLSAGRDRALLERLARAVTEAGAEMLDRSADPDHNRAVLTFAGSPAEVEEAAVAVARMAVEAIDLRVHRGVHPRLGALDVLPFVPLAGLAMEDARASAHRVGRRLAEEVGVPVYFYGFASDPPGRLLSELRRGGFEGLAAGAPPDRIPDLAPPGWEPGRVHPTAGVTCVGARPLLLAWNVDVRGVAVERLRIIAAALRESGGGFAGLRALALDLPGQRRAQISMNLEDVATRDPFEVFRVLEERVRAEGGEVEGTEVIGLCPDELVLGAGADRLRLRDPDPRRMLSVRLAAHIAERSERAATRILNAARSNPEPVPASMMAAVERLAADLGASPDLDGKE